jgi:Predicted nucleotidyltransferases
VREITQELYKDKNVLALMLYGSVSRHEESVNSDIDLLIIINEKYCQKRHIIRYGITVEYLEMHIEYLQNFIAENEIPVLFTLTEGIVLFDKNSLFEQFIAEARNIIRKGPPINKKWENERYKTKRRSEVTEIYKDLLDLDDEITFNYLISLLITNVIPLLIENYKLWTKTRKKTINYLKSQCYDGYKYIEILLSSKFSLPEKRNAAKDLIEYALKQHVGIWGSWYGKSKNQKLTICLSTSCYTGRYNCRRKC